MFKQYLILLFLAHIIADFYIQTNKMDKKKVKYISWVLIHSLCYWAVMLVITLPIMSVKFVLGVTIAAVFHCLIDIVKFFYITHKEKSGKLSLEMDRNVFFTDQILHLLVIIGISYGLAKSNAPLNIHKIFSDFLNVIGVSGKLLMSWLFAILVIHKPANIAISKFLLIYKPEDNRPNKLEVNNINKLEDNKKNKPDDEKKNKPEENNNNKLEDEKKNKPEENNNNKLDDEKKNKLEENNNNKLEDEKKNKPEKNINNKPDDNPIKDDRKAGRYIGTIERMIMLIFISINQYSAIGLVLTAKSIARYERITKEEHFAEYYLLGTLISTLIAIIVSFVI